MDGTITGITINFADSDSIIDAIKAGVTTPALLAEVIDGAELIEDCLVLDPNEWHADDGNAEIIGDFSSGKKAAQSYVDGGDWGDNDNSTAWIDVRVWLAGIDADGDTVDVSEESHTITIEPEEPDCVDGEGHDWQSPVEIVGGCKENPGVFGHGGGVIMQEVCMRCGCGKKTDTWAQNPSNGVEGLTSVSYEEDRYTAEVDALIENS